MTCTVVKLPKITATSVEPGTSASSDPSFSSPNDVADGTYLDFDGVPSNSTGYIVKFDGFLTFAAANNENTNTFTVEIRKRVAAGQGDAAFTTILTLNVVAAKSQNFTGLLVPILAGEELCAKKLSGTCRNLSVQITPQQS